MGHPTTATPCAYTGPTRKNVPRTGHGTLNDQHLQPARAALPGTSGNSWESPTSGLRYVQNRAPPRWRPNRRLLPSAVECAAQEFRQVLVGDLTRIRRLDVDRFAPLGVVHRHLHASDVEGHPSEEIVGTDVHRVRDLVRELGCL